MNIKKDIRKKLIKHLDKKLEKNDPYIFNEVVNFIKKDRAEQLILSGVTQCEDIEPTNKTEEIQVSVDKKLFVELYNFAYKQSVKTNTVAELHDIDRRLHGG